MTRIVHLTPPLLSLEHIKEKITCIRAHRERIFQVKTEMVNDTLICHNYGHGGAGWTFLFGCVNESIRQFEEQLNQNPSLKNKSIAVIGAGCFGLLTAIELSRRGYYVRIIAQELHDISSHKAAGFFFARPRKSSKVQERAVFQTLGMESYATYLEIIKGNHPFIKTGPKLLPAYYGMDIDPEFAPYIANGLLPSPEKVTINFGNGKQYGAMEYTTVFINPAEIMKELDQAARGLHIPFIQATIDSFCDVQDSIIFNCAGLGSKKLTGDERIIPVQGHLITLRNQPPIDQLQYMINVKVVMPNLKGMPRDELIYFAPKESGILGITFIRGQDSLTANDHEFDRLLTRCRDFFGSL